VERIILVEVDEEPMLLLLAGFALPRRVKLPEKWRDENAAPDPCAEEGAVVD
jgi:hypothetical protein